jgi:Ca-activated chloride channel family protein
MNWTHPPGTTEYLLIAVFFTVYVLYILRTFRIAKKFGTKPRSLFIKLIHRTLILGLMLTALAGPYFGEVERKLLVLGKDIYLAVDVSRSMEATDVVPSRLEKVKYELNLLTQQLANNRIGLIAFSNDAFIQSPLTYDTESLQFLIQSLDTQLLPRQGTNVCAAIQLAYDKMQVASDVNNSKVLVVLTDGEEGTRCSSELLQKLKREEYQVFYVGVGTVGGSTIPTPDGPLRDDRGEVVVTRLDESALLKLADETSSSYFRIDDENVETEELIQSISTSQTHRVDTRSIDVADNKYYYFLGIALLLLTLDVLITFRTFRV